MRFKLQIISWWAEIIAWGLTRLTEEDQSLFKHPNCTYKWRHAHNLTLPWQGSCLWVFLVRAAVQNHQLWCWTRPVCLLGSQSSTGPSSFAEERCSGSLWTGWQGSWEKGDNHTQKIGITGVNEGEGHRGHSVSFLQCTVSLGCSREYTWM